MISILAHVFQLVIAKVNKQSQIQIRFLFIVKISANTLFKFDSMYYSPSLDSKFFSSQ